MIFLRDLSPNGAYFYLLRLATENALSRKQSRIGSFIDLGHVCVEFDEGERLCLLNGRAVNPVFAIVEAAWMLAGSNDLSPLEAILSDYKRFSDDGETLNGAYGFRLRSYFGFDQIDSAVKELKDSPVSRRVVLSLFSSSDLGKQSADIPCNTQLVLSIEDARLAMTVINRSNDLWLGVPYNWFTFRILQDFIAREVGIPAGNQRHISTCMHLYERDAESARAVVRKNNLDYIQEIEGSLDLFDSDLIFKDLLALSQADFASVRSLDLGIFFQRYLQSRKLPTLRMNARTEAKQRSVLDFTLNQWISDRKRPKETQMPILDNHDTAIHLALQQFVNSGDAQNPELLEGLRNAAINVRPLLPSLLNKDLPAGVQIAMDSAFDEQVSQHIILELLLGCLDPELRKTEIGTNFTRRLRGFATQLGLVEQRFIGREVPEKMLGEVFLHILKTNGAIQRI